MRFPFNSQFNALMRQFNETIEITITVVVSEVYFFLVVQLSLSHVI